MSGRSPRARSSRHKIDVITVPRLSGVRFRVTPPAYTRRSAYEGALPAGGLAGLAGTHVEVWATSNRPLASGTLELAGASAPRTVELVPTAPAAQEVHGSFEIRADGKIEIRVRDCAGQQSQDALSASVVLLRDERPFIRITEPREVSFATPDVMLPVVLAAEDDYGIARVQLFRARTARGRCRSTCRLGSGPQPGGTTRRISRSRNTACGPAMRSRSSRALKTTTPPRERVRKRRGAASDHPARGL